MLAAIWPGATLSTHGKTSREDLHLRIEEKLDLGFILVSSQNADSVPSQPYAYS